MSHHYSGPDYAFPHGDPRLNFTDLYVFPKAGDTSRSVLIMNVHPSVGFNPPGPTTTDPFSEDALYEVMIDTDGDYVVNVAYSVRFESNGGERCGAVSSRTCQTGPSKCAASWFSPQGLECRASYRSWCGSPDRN